VLQQQAGQTPRADVASFSYLAILTRVVDVALDAMPLARLLLSCVAQLEKRYRRWIRPVLGLIPRRRCRTHTAVDHLQGLNENKRVESVLGGSDPTCQGGVEIIDPSQLSVAS
jgi:hypothetical protein